jgi:hypothetical protein
MRQSTSYKSVSTFSVIRSEALLLCRFLYGTGMSMWQAQSRVAEALGETPENVRNWDRANNKGLQMDPKKIYLVASE